MKETEKYFHPLSVRFKEQDGFRYEYDEHDRVTYHHDRWGYFALLFYHDAKHLNTPYYVQHKYHRLYNPEPALV